MRRLAGVGAIDAKTGKVERGPVKEKERGKKEREEGERKLFFRF